MLFMVIEQFRNQDGKSVYRRLRQKGRLMPDGLEFVNSWVAADLGRCFQLMECSDIALLQQWIAEWSDLIDFEIVPVVPGKKLRLVVGVGVGSGYDINARLLARHLAAHIPGQPTIVVQNQPGAGSLTMTNALYHTGPFDGTVMGASFNGMPTTPLLQPTGVRFDPVK